MVAVCVLVTVVRSIIMHSDMAEPHDLDASDVSTTKHVHIQSGPALVLI